MAQPTTLTNIDANLLVALHALIEEASVERAARRLRLTSSAASHALARLRAVFGDPLLTRAGRGLVRTARAEALREPLRQVIADIEGILRAARPFTPGEAQGGWRLITTDHVRVVLMAELDRIMRLEAPLMNLYQLPFERGAPEALRAGQADLAIGVWDELPADFGRETLFEDTFAVVVRRGHPIAKKRLDLARFAALDHVLVAPTGSPVGLVDKLLREHGLSRRVARTLPSFIDAAHLVASSDYVSSLPTSFVAQLSERFGLVTLKLPLPFPRFTHAMIWHRRLDADPPHLWLRAAITRASRGAGS